MSNRIWWLNPLTGNATESAEPDEAIEQTRAPNPPVMLDIGYTDDGWFAAVGPDATVSTGYLWFRAAPVTQSVPQLRQRQRFVR